MKYLHTVAGAAIIVYAAINCTKLGIGELLSFFQFWGIIIIAATVFKKDLTGMFFASMIFGAAFEWVTEAYWDYSLKVYLWRDISLFVIIGWGYSITIFVLLSNWIFGSLTRQKGTIKIDWRIIPCDMVVGTIWFVANEFLGMKILHLWAYSKASRWTHMVPGLDYPIEGIIGTALFSVIMSAFVRFWEKDFRWCASPGQENPLCRNS